ncbi:MAG TPA: hypothetical protein VMB24_04545 [Dehalococcoidales bacterium]|nr:hypothetical protein [Dehalococcoidales bacterium]
MKKLLILLLLITIPLVIAGCSSVNPGKVYSNDGNTSIIVPSGWNTNDREINKIFPAAVIVASNNASQEYVAVIGLPKSYVGNNSTLNSFFALIKASSAATVTGGVWGTPSAVNINGLAGLTARFTGVLRQSKVNTTFFVNELENNNYYYAVLAFTDTAMVTSNEATLQNIINSFRAPATTVTRGTWKPYSYPQTVILAAILLILGLGLALIGSRLKHSVDVPHPGKKLKIGMITGWAVVILFILGVVIFYRFGRTHIGTGQANIGPIFPVTLACAVVAFVYTAYIYRHDEFWTTFGRAFICAAAGPMIFEFPFDMIVMPQIKATATFLTAYFIPLDAAVLLTLSLLLLSRRVSISRYSMYALGAMFVVFAVWAWFGYSYPSNTISYACNAISKVLGFAAIVFLFRRGPELEAKAQE